MVQTQNPISGEFALIPRKGTFGAPEGAENWQIFALQSPGVIAVGGSGAIRCRPYSSIVSAWDNLPAAAVAAGTDQNFKVYGTSPVITRAAKAGVNLQSKVSSPATNDFISLGSAPNNASIIPITAVSQPRYAARVMPNQVTGVIGYFGFNQTFAAGVVDPTTAAGDGFGFLLAPDPTGGAGTALTNSTGCPTTGNWILFQKVNGTFYFLDSGIAPVAGQTYDLVCELDNTMTPTWYINGQNVGTAAQAQTAAVSVGVVSGIVLQLTTPVGQVDFDIRHLETNRLPG